MCDFNSSSKTYYSKATPYQTTVCVVTSNYDKESNKTCYFVDLSLYDDRDKYEISINDIKVTNNIAESPSAKTYYTVVDGENTNESLTVNISGQDIDCAKTNLFNLQ